MNKLFYILMLSMAGITSFNIYSETTTKIVTRWACKVYYNGVLVVRDFGNKEKALKKCESPPIESKYKLTEFDNGMFSMAPV